MTIAEICQRNGWAPGDIFLFDGLRGIPMQLTAIGLQNWLVRYAHRWRENSAKPWEYQWAFEREFFFVENRMRKIGTGPLDATPPAPEFCNDTDESSKGT